MAATTLYPPIVDTYMPAFIVDKDNTGVCRVYFAISDYNALGNMENPSEKDNEIYNAFISITNQYTNESVVDIEKYNSGLINLDRSKIRKDATRTGDDCYYVEINSNDLKDKKWNRGEVYKIQIRFCSISNIENTMSWLNANTRYLSEWSTVCLVQGILKPIITLKNFPSGNQREVIFNITDNHIIGNISFDSLDNDFLNTYKIQLLKQSDLKTILYDSGNIYSYNISNNEINHFIKYNLEDGVRYILRIYYLSDKLYKETLDYKFYVLDVAGAPIDATIKAEADNSQGRIKLSVKSDYETFLGGISIRRASSETNFTIWEDIKTVLLDGTEPINIEWYDNSIKSGVWYKYCAQKRNAYGHRGVAIVTKEPTMVFLDDMFLIGENNEQLKIKFNPQISGYSITMSESSTQTIGSQYPFIKRNGNIKYKQFTISGLISHFMDDGKTFMDSDKVFSNEVKNLYQAYNEKNRITPYNDFTYEKIFRDRVYDFLTDGKVKLFKSSPEGNILVRLMNVSFNPEVVLGRMLYNFSATAIEIDNCSIEKLDYYNIQTIGTYPKQLFYTKNKTKILSNVSLSSLKDYLLEYEEKIKDPEDNKKIGIDKITDIKIQFNFNPYLIKVSEEELIKLNNKPNISDEQIEQIVSGYIIQIDDANIVGSKDILIGNHGYYELNNASIDDIKIIGTNKSENKTVDIVCSYILTEEENINIIPNILTYYETESQDIHMYYPTENIILKYIYDKHNIKNDLNYEKLYSINKMAIEANPNSVFYLQDNSNSEYKKVLINDTGYLDLSESDYFYTGMYALGTHLIKKEKVDLNVIKQEIVSEFEFIDCTYKTQASGELFNSPYELEEYLLNTENEFLQNHGVYLVANLSNNDNDEILYRPNFEEITIGNSYLELLQKYFQTKENGYYVIYYDNNWYLFNFNSQDMIHPVGAMINYYGEIEKGEFIE